MLALSLRVTNTILLHKNTLQKLLLLARNIQISVIGAGSEIGSNVALLLKQNHKVTRLHLHDDDDKVNGIGMELAHVPGGPAISTFAGNSNLGPSITGSHIILMTTRIPRKHGRTRDEMMAENALPVQYLCRAVAGSNPYAFLAISTNPINSIIPFACALLCKYNCYNPSKVFGITHIDTARIRVLAGSTLQVNPLDIDVPVIGGHSEQTIVPLFSNINPSRLSVDPRIADTLTRLVRKAGREIILQKKGHDSAIIAVAWSIHDFADGLIDAINGTETTLNCYTVNPNFGTRFFSGPTCVGRDGIIRTCYDFQMNEFEKYLLNNALPMIHRDVSLGEEHVRYIEQLGKSW